jgi:hypothetical protein
MQRNIIYIYIFIDASQFTYTMSKVYISYKYKSIDIMPSVMLTYSWLKFIDTHVNEFKILMKKVLRFQILLYMVNIEPTSRFLLLYRFCNKYCVCDNNKKNGNKRVRVVKIVVVCLYQQKRPIFILMCFSIRLTVMRNCAKPRPRFELGSYLWKQSIFPIPNLHYMSPHSRLMTSAVDSVAKQLIMKRKFILQPF